MLNVISETAESNSPQTRFGFNATKLKTYYISDSELLASYTNRMWLNKIEPPHEYATANISLYVVSDDDDMHTSLYTRK